MKSTIKLFSMAVFVSIMLFGCYPNEDIYYSDTDVAVTRYDDKFTFEQDMVCVLFDTVMHVVDEDKEPKEGVNDAHMLKEIERNLKENTKFIVYVVKDSMELINEGINPDDVDLVVTTTVMETEHYYTSYYPWYGYWGWGYGWYKKAGSLKSADNTNYYYYPYYPWYGGTYYAYTTGTIFIDMIDVKSIEEEDDKVKLPVVWNGVMNGILSGNTTDQKNRITTQVDKCFKQSPYLN